MIQFIALMTVLDILRSIWKGDKIMVYIMTLAILGIAWIIN